MFKYMLSEQRFTRLNPVFAKFLENSDIDIEYDKTQELFNIYDSDGYVDWFSVGVNHQPILAYFIYYATKCRRFCYDTPGLKRALDEFKKYVEHCGSSAKKIPYNEWRTLIKWTNDKDASIYSCAYIDDKSDTVYEVFINTKYPGEPVIIKDIFVFADIDYKPYTNDCPWDDEKIINTVKENKTMNIPSMNFEFGPVDSSIQMSPYGLAVRDNNGEFLAYDFTNAKVVNVTGFTFDFKGMIYKMPVASKDLREGDMVLHLGKPMVIIDIADNVIDVIDPVESEAKAVLPVTNIFGFNFVTKIAPLINFDGATPNPDQPFGNLMPMMMASAFFNKDDKDGRGFMDGDMKDLMMFSWMTGGQSPFGNLFNFNVSNPNQ